MVGTLGASKKIDPDTAKSLLQTLQDGLNQPITYGDAMFALLYLTAIGLVVIVIQRLGRMMDRMSDPPELNKDKNGG